MASNVVAGSNAIDPFDTSELKNKVDGAGLATVVQVSELESKAKVLFNVQRNRAAAEALSLFSTQANALANIIVTGIQPYYNAAHADQQKCSNIAELANFEAMANQYRLKRNRARVMQAECLIAIGEEMPALQLLMETINLIPIDDKIWWDRARKALYDLAGVAP